MLSKLLAVLALVLVLGFVLAVVYALPLSSRAAGLTAVSAILISVTGIVTAIAVNSGP